MYGRGGAGGGRGAGGRDEIAEALVERGARGGEEGPGRKLAEEGAVEMEEVGLCGRRHFGVFDLG